jgi:hypothetical protein
MADIEVGNEKTFYFFPLSAVCEGGGGAICQKAHKELVVLHRTASH